jgi:hypothetical protein
MSLSTPFAAPIEGALREVAMDKIYLILTDFLEEPTKLQT